MQQRYQCESACPAVTSIGSVFTVGHHMVVGIVVALVVAAYFARCSLHLVRKGDPLF